MSGIHFTSPTTPLTAQLQSKEPHQAKRKRVNLACERCRYRKSRCDGQQPICVNCEKASAECVYREPAWHTRTQGDFDNGHPANAESTQGRDPGYQQALETRMKAMEERLRKFESNKTSDLSPTNISKLTPGLEPRFDGHGLTNDAQSPSTIDAMGTMSFADEQESAFFGPSSNIAFLGLITNAIKATQNPAFSHRQVQHDSRAAIVNTQRPGGKHGQRDKMDQEPNDLYILPSEEEVMNLAQEFFSNTGLLFPYVHADSFYQTYARARSKSSKTMKLSWLSLCNMVLANAVSSSIHDSQSVRHRTERAEIFYKRGTALSRHVDDQGTSLEEVQSLLLATQYLQGTQRSVQTYSAHGRAVRAAFSLGLHSPDTLRRYSSLEQEMRKRTWYACILIDRNLSMTFGRPPSIPESFVKVPSPNNIFLSSNSAMGFGDQQNMLKCLGLNFFSSTISLYRITSEVIDVLYGQNIGDGEQENFSALLSYMPPLAEKLHHWADYQPEYLQPASSLENEPDDIKHTRQRLITILQLRRLNLSNLIHRPVLQKLLDLCCSPTAANNAASLSLIPFITPSIESLMSSSINLITLIHDSKGRKRMLGAWWYSLYYTFNSALILIAIFIVNRSQAFAIQISMPGIGKTLHMAVEGLGFLDKGNMMVERCRAYLQKLINVVMSDETASEGGHWLSNPADTTLDQPTCKRKNTELEVTKGAEVEQSSTQPTVLGVDMTGSFGALGDMNTLDIGPFMTDDDLNFLSFFTDPQEPPRP